MLIYADSMTRHIGSFQILFLGSCPQSDTETESSLRYGFIKIRIQINYRSWEKYANFVHRQGATDHKSQG